MSNNNNNDQDEVGREAAQDGEWTIEPEFLNPDEVEEVIDVDEVELMDDDDDDDDDDALEEDANNNAINLPDTSNVQIRSHNGPVYCVTAALLRNSNDESSSSSSSSSLLVVSGGGDDRAYLHQLKQDDNSHTTRTTKASTADATTTTAVVVAVESTLLSHVHSDTVSCVAHNLNCKSTATAVVVPLVAVGGYDGAIVVYDATTLQLLGVLEGPTDVEWLTFHTSGTVLLAGSSSDGTVWMYHVASNKSSSWSCLQVLVGHAGTVTAGAFTPDGKWAVTTGADGSLRIWAPKTGVARHVVTFAQQHDANDDESDAAIGLTCLAMGAPDSTTSKLVLVGAEDGSAHVVHVGTGKILHSLRHYESMAATVPLHHDDENDELVEEPRSVEAVAFCPSNPLWCATGGMDGTLKIWDLTTGQVRQVFRFMDSADDNDATTLPNGGITQLAWHDTLPIVFTATTTGVIRLWDARNGALVTSRTTGGSGGVTINAMQVVFVDETKTIAIAASDDHAVRLFDVNVPALLQAANRQT
jgi:WD40 repeat protein